MNKPFSIYLDLVRFLAACMVYLYHSNQRWLVAEPLPASNLGHSSVIVFFVLSGFVIAYITDTRERLWTTYAASRLSRVYSVALPAVFLTILLDAVGRLLYPVPYQYPFDNFLVRTLASLFMANEVWFVSITSFSNVPYWSICYEMWYYAAFGLFMFLQGPWRIASLALLTLVLGPKVLLLGPIWVLGVVLYRWGRTRSISELTGWILALGSAIGIVAFETLDVTGVVATYFKAMLGADRHVQLTFSKFFPSDYVLGVLVFANFVGVQRIAPRCETLFLAIEKPVRFLAAYTLSLYLLHQPLFLFWGAVVRGNPDGPAYWWVTTALVALSVFGIGYVTENKRHGLKTWIEKRLDVLDRHLRRPRGRIA